MQQPDLYCSAFSTNILPIRTGVLSDKGNYIYTLLSHPCTRSSYRAQSVSTCETVHCSVSYSPVGPLYLLCNTKGVFCVERKRLRLDSCVLYISVLYRFVVFFVCAQSIKQLVSIQLNEFHLSSYRLRNTKVIEICELTSDLVYKFNCKI